MLTHTCFSYMFHMWLKSWIIPLTESDFGNPRWDSWVRLTSCLLFYHQSQGYNLFHLKFLQRHHMKAVHLSCLKSVQCDVTTGRIYFMGETIKHACITWNHYKIGVLWLLAWNTQSTGSTVASHLIAMMYRVYVIFVRLIMLAVTHINKDCMKTGL